MPGTGSYIGGSSSADYYYTAPELLTQLPDNTANLIVAKDIRDSVWTLWNRIDDVEIIAGSAASASAYFQNSSPTPITVGGIPSGTTFVTPTDMQTMWNQLLYPYVSPGAAFSPSSSTRQYGSSLPLTLNWSATKNSNPITTIIVDLVAQVVTGVSQVGAKAATGTHSVTPGVSQINSFTMSVGDGTTSTGATYNLTWMNRRYWGYVDLSSIGNPNLTTNPGSASLVASLCTDSVVRNLTGANANAQAFGSELSTSKSKTYTGIDGGGRHLIFAWPSNVSGALTPTFTVNGLPNTAFTKVRTASVFVNQFGFAGSNFEVWVSNTTQASPLNIVIS